MNAWHHFGFPDLWAACISAKKGWLGEPQLYSQTTNAVQLCVGSVRIAETSMVKLMSIRLSFAVSFASLVARTCQLRQVALHQWPKIRMSLERAKDSICVCWWQQSIATRSRQLSREPRGRLLVRRRCRRALRKLISVYKLFISRTFMRSKQVELLYTTPLCRKYGVW